MALAVGWTPGASSRQRACGRETARLPQGRRPRGPGAVGPPRGNPAIEVSTDHGALRRALHHAEHAPLRLRHGQRVRTVSRADRDGSAAAATPWRLWIWSMIRLPRPVCERRASSSRSGPAPDEPPVIGTHRVKRAGHSAPADGRLGRAIPPHEALVFKLGYSRKSCLLTFSVEHRRWRVHEERFAGGRRRAVWCSTTAEGG